MAEKEIDEEQALRGSLRQGDYVKERTAWIRAQREVTELKLAQMRAELAPVGALGMAIGSVAASVKQSVFAVPSAVSQGCVGKTAEEVHALLHDALRVAFEPFDEAHIERLIVAACEGVGDAAGAGSSAPAAVQRKRVGRRRKKAKPGVKRKPGSVAH